MAHFSVTTTSSSSKLLPLFLSFSISCTRFHSLPPSTTSSFSFPIPSNLLPIQPLSTSHRPVRCRAATPGPPPPPRIDPPPGNDSGKLQDLAASLSKIQDRVQVFFAVLFWMSLFFWASAWDGRNRPDKGSKFRK